VEFSINLVHSLIGGEVVIYKSTDITGFSGLEDAGPNDITFIDSEKFVDLLPHCNAGLILSKPNFKSALQDTGHNHILIDEPREALAILLSEYKKAINNFSGVSENAMISKESTIGNDTYVGAAIICAGVSVGNKCEIHDGVIIEQDVSIGDGCIFHSGVRIMNGSIIGNDVTIQPNAVIGGDGFGFVPNSENKYMKIAHVGNVVIKDHVEIGAGTCIDRGTMGSTIIRKGVKLDNLIQVAHNVDIGENTVIAAQTGIAGSAVIGKNCMIGGQVGIVGHIRIADGVKIAAQSGIGHSIPEAGTIVQGSPAFKIREYKMSYVGFKRLPDIMKKISELEKEIEHLKSK